VSVLGQGRLRGSQQAEWHPQTDQTVVVRLRGLAQVPGYVFGVHNLRADLVAVQHENYGWPGRQPNKLRQ